METQSVPNDQDSQQKIIDILTSIVEKKVTRKELFIITVSLLELANDQNNFTHENN